MGYIYSPEEKKDKVRALLVKKFGEHFGEELFTALSEWMDHTVGDIKNQLPSLPQWIRGEQE